MAAKNGAKPAVLGNSKLSNDRLGQTERIKRQSLFIRVMTIDELISEGEEIKKSISPTHRMAKEEEYYSWQQRVSRFLNQQVPGDMVIENFEKAVNGFNSSYCSPQSFENVLSVLRGFKEFPEKTTKAKSQKKSTNKLMDNVNITNNITQNQEQNQGQAIVSIVFEESIKDELTGNQVKALRKILNDDTLDSSQKKEQLEGKFKEFGPEVMSKVLANIVEHPEVLPRI